MTTVAHPNEAHPREGRFSPTSLEDACPRKYYLGKVMGLQRKGEESQYLTMGTSIHHFVENWQALRMAGVEGDELLETAIVQSYELASKLLPSWKEDAYSFENWLFTCEGYHNKWKNDSYIPFKLETISWVPMENGTLLGGVMDCLIRRPNGTVVIRDTKTTGRNLTDWFWKGMENKFQLSMYYHMLSDLFPMMEIMGVEIDAVVISKKREKPSENYQRRIFERTPLQIADAKNTFIKKTNFIIEGLEHDNPISYFHQEQSQCGNYGGCQFLPICLHGLHHPSVYTDFQQRDSAVCSED